MKRLNSRFGWTFFVVALFCSLPVAAQDPSPTPALTKPTVISRPLTDSANAVDDATAAIPDAERPRADVEKPSLESILYSSEGVLIETPEGKTVLSQYADVGYNPAS